MNNILLEAPCLFCGYNGSGYFQTGTHSKDCPWYGIGGEKDRAFVFRGVVSALYNKVLAAQPPTQQGSEPADITREFNKRHGVYGPSGMDITNVNKFPRGFLG